MSDAESLFDEHHCVRQDLLHASKNVMKYAGYFLKMCNSEVATFNWFWFLWDIRNNRCDSDSDSNSKSDITIEKHGNEHIEQYELNIDSMVDKIMNILFKFSNMAIRTGDKDAITARVKNTFTNLSRQETSIGLGFIDFYRESHGTNSSYTYRIGFSFPHESSATHFYAVIATIELKAYVHELTIYWNRTCTYKFSADITYIKLKCTKDFVAGEKPLSILSACVLQ